MRIVTNLNEITPSNETFISLGVVLHANIPLNESIFHSGYLASNRNIK